MAESALRHWRDEVVETELRIHAYPYGGGQPGTGIQVTVDSRHRDQVLAVRLSTEEARQLAHAILAAIDPERPPVA